MYWFLWKSWFGGQSKSTHFNANPWISTDINDVLWKSMIFKDFCLFQCISKKSNEFHLESMNFSWSWMNFNTNLRVSMKINYSNAYQWFSMKGMNFNSIIIFNIFRNGSICSLLNWNLCFFIEFHGLHWHS